ncbi:MAG: alpha-L-rhamnosidase C-terminal domain-containing protein [Sphaerochaeta sp.]|nr:alpha-L-rhamnosidase C-terminal domain-containing protein [Sphaerochaeta sp.]
MQDVALESNRYLYFRTTFELFEETVVSTPFIVSADGRYQLFLDGFLVGRGPERSHPLAHYADSSPLAGMLVKPGIHVLAALVHSYGKSTSWYKLPHEEHISVFGCGGFFLQGGIGPCRMDTGKEWKYLISEAWEQKTPFGGTGFCEYYNASLEPEGWKIKDFDDSAWSEAFELKVPLEKHTTVRPFPAMRLASTIRNINSSVYPSETINRKHGLTAIFESLVVGYIRFKVSAIEKCEIAIQYGERLDSDKHVFIPPVVPGIASPPMHRFTVKQGVHDYALFEPAGLRAIELTWTAESSPTIEEVSLELYGTTTKTGGAFECSDKALNKMYAAGARTVSRCLMDSYVDCPTREQRCWTGDVYVSSLVGYRCLGEYEAAKKYLLDTAMTQRSDGMVLMASSCDLSDHDYSYIPDFALLWILAVEQYFLHTGDRVTVNALMPYIYNLLRWFEPFCNTFGLLEDVPGWVFFEWADALERQGCTTVLNALYAAALKGASKLFPEMILPDWKQKVTAMEQLLWSDERNAYLDGVGSNVVSQHANSLMVCFDFAPKEKWNPILETISDASTVVMTKTWSWDTVSRAFNPLDNVVMAQPFYAHFLHAAYAHAKRGDLLQTSLLRWQDMLKTYDTFWESWELTSISSTCHGFSATPAFDCSAYILGVSILESGFRTVSIQPLILPRVSYARGAIPTPLGNLEVSVTIQESDICLEIEIPQGMTVLVSNTNYYCGKHKICYER